MIFSPPVTQAPAPLPFTSLKAEYKWSIHNATDSGSGSLVLRLEPGPGKLVLEVFTYGDRLALVDGDAAGGYQIVLPKEHVNRIVPSLSELPLPFIPQTGSIEALARALADGEGAGLSVEKRDVLGPVILRFTGRDGAGKPVWVQLTRKRWLPGN